jgi:hypothetical protein
MVIVLALVPDPLHLVPAARLLHEQHGRDVDDDAGGE